MFNTLCQPPAFENVVLATTKWSDVPVAKGDLRQQQLSQQHWTGLNVARFDNTYESAWAIVDRIFEKDPVDAVLLHQNLASLQSRLSGKAQARITGGFFTYLFRGRRGVRFHIFYSIRIIYFGVLGGVQDLRMRC